MTIGNKIRFFRNLRGYTQDELEEYILQRIYPAETISVKRYPQKDIREIDIRKNDI